MYVTRHIGTLRILFLVFLWMEASTGWAQLAVVTNKFTTNDGLSDNAVLCALRDSYGMLWVGTENGLNCFDGVRIRAFRDMGASESTNETNTVMSLYEHKGNIWYGGLAGFYVFNRFTNTFTRFNKSTRYGVLISSTVPKIVGQGKLIWIITMGQGIFVYDTENDTLEQDSRHGNFFSDIVVGGNGLIYAVTLSGQMVIYRGDGQFLRSRNLTDSPNDRNTISMVIEGEDVWFANGTRLLRLKPVADEPDLQINLPELGAIHALTASTGGKIYLASDNGVYVHSPQEGKTERVDGVDEANQLTDVLVNGLMWDSDSTLLVFTRGGGINFLSMHQRGLQFLTIPKERKSGERNVVHAFCRGPQGELWIGTDHGLFWVAYPNPLIHQETKLPPYEINTLMLDGSDLWIGTRHDGIRVLNLNTGQIQSHTFSNTEPYNLPSNEVNCIYRTSQGDIYVLTSWGLSRFERSSGHFYGYANINAMTSFICMQEAASGWLWASSVNKGLFCKRTNDERFEVFNSATLGRQTVSMMLSDRQGELWAVVNGGGLYRFDPHQGDFSRYDIEGTVLHDQEVNFIEEDEQGAIWLGTAAGVICIGPSRDVSGLQVYSFPHNANYFQLQRSSSAHGHGYLLFGGDGGFYRFNANEMTPDAKRLKVYIQELFLPYANDSKKELKRIGLDVLLYTRDKIELPYADNSFTLRFSSVRFAGMPIPKFEYMLKGFDHNWVQNSNTSEATYANLPPGEYEFLLRPLGQTDENGTARLRIIILPPWYLTKLAFLIYLVLIAAAIVGVYYLTQHRIQRRYQREMSDFQQQQEKETFNSKIRFFIDLVHEIRTPLTLMSLPLEQMEDNKHTSAIRRNMNYLLGITNQLLDFQKQENGGITLVKRRTDMRKMLQQLYDQFSDAAEVQGMKLQMQVPSEPVVLNIDRDKMMKVLMNLVGNALKYTKTEIIVRMTADKDVAISVIDDGPGIAPEEQGKIFNRYYQIGDDHIASSVGTGLGLAYAKMLAEAHEGDLCYKDAPGGGSCFILTLLSPDSPIEEDVTEALNDELLQTEEGVTAQKTGAAENAVGGNGTFRILLVEDNEELLKATAEALRKWYVVLKAHDGVEALDILNYQDVDVVVSDVMMPRMDGVELCRRLKQNVETSHLPVILLTAKVSVDAKVEGMESGADIYLEKPFSIRQLRAQIENILRLRQQFYERMKALDGFHTAAADLSDKPLGLNQQDLQFVENLQKLVEENMRDEEFSIDTLAEQLNLSRSSFYRKIKALTGMTPSDYLKNARMNQAAHLLRSGLRSSEVAERVGFTSSSYFAKCFKAQFGCLPKDYV